MTKGWSLPSRSYRVAGNTEKWKTIITQNYDGGKGEKKIVWPPSTTQKVREDSFLIAKFLKFRTWFFSPKTGCKDLSHI